MSDINQAFCLILLILFLGACLIRAFWEIETARERRRQRENLVRDAMRSVVN